MEPHAAKPAPDATADKARERVVNGYDIERIEAAARKKALEAVERIDLSLYEHSDWGSGYDEGLSRMKEAATDAILALIEEISDELDRLVAHTLSHQDLSHLPPTPMGDFAHPRLAQRIARGFRDARSELARKDEQLAARDEEIERLKGEIGRISRGYELRLHNAHVNREAFAACAALAEADRAAARCVDDEMVERAKRGWLRGQEMQLSDEEAMRAALTAALSPGQVGEETKTWWQGKVFPPIEQSYSGASEAPQGGRAVTERPKRVRLKKTIGPYDAGTEHDVIEVVPHGGHTDAAEQFVIGRDTYVTSDQVDVLSEPTRYDAAVAAVERLGIAGAVARQPGSARRWREAGTDADDYDCGLVEGEHAFKRRALAALRALPSAPEPDTSEAVRVLVEALHTLRAHYAGPGPVSVMWNDIEGALTHPAVLAAQGKASPAREAMG